MLVAGFPAGSLAANCYVVAPAPGEECVVIDTGQDASDGVDEIVKEHRLKPVAVLLTHGHFDHTLSVVPVCGARGIPAYIHPDDREMLADPGKVTSFAAAAGSSVKVDQGFGMQEMLQLAASMRLSGASSIHSFTLPTAGTGTSADGQSIVNVDQGAVARLRTALADDALASFGG